RQCQLAQQETERLNTLLAAQAPALALAEVALLLEVLSDHLDLVWEMLGKLNTRAEAIRDTHARGSAEDARTVKVLDDALVNLHYARDGLMASRHLLSNARRDFDTATRRHHRVPAIDQHADTSVPLVPALVARLVNALNTRYPNPHHKEPRQPWPTRGRS
ncbi:hypothetical protein ACFQ07_27475, partial [Actinomadura adrarensis]